MLAKKTIMLQPRAYYSHTMLMNIINFLHQAPMHQFIRVTLVITKWLRVQEVVVTTVILVLLADSQTVQSQEVALYYTMSILDHLKPATKSHLSRKCHVREAQHQY